MTDATHLIAALDVADLSDEQRRVANYVLQHTVAEGRKGVVAPPASIAHACRLKENVVRWALRRLVAKGIVREASNRMYGLSPTLSINPDPTAWRILPRLTATKE